MENVELGNLGTITAAQAVTAIYIGYYDRAPDPAGLDFWVGDLGEPFNGGVFGLSDVATAFATEAGGEAQRVHEFFTNPTPEGAEAFLESLYQNIFGRAADDEGKEFWTPRIEASVAEGSTESIGDIILEFIKGAKNNENGQDLAVIQNKIIASEAWTAAAREVDGFTYDNTDSPEAASATGVLDGVDDTAASVAEALAEVDSFFGPLINPSVPGEDFFLTSKTDVIPGTANDDKFYAYIAQNEFAGGVSNSLSSADRLDGGAGNDELYAEITGEFVGVVGNVSNLDIQPRVTDIETIKFEARESTFLTVEELNEVNNFTTFGTTTVDAKNINGHNEIGSYFSDGDLKIENLTTLASDGVTARNTSEITVTMDHTDNFNSDDDASDLIVLFDNDYLLSGQTSVGTADFFLLDQDAELRILRGQSAEGRLDEIDKNGIRFSINGQEVTVEFDGDLLDEANAAEINSHDAFIAALQAPLQALIDAGTLPVGTEIVRFDFDAVQFDEDVLALNRAGLQDGSFSNLIPSVRVISGDGSPVTPLGFTAPDEITGEFNVFGRFDNDFAQGDEPVSIDIDLHKVGRGGDGGNLVIGGKQLDGPTQPGIEGGIEVFNVDVLGAGNKPSSLGTLTSTQGALKVVNIATATEFRDGDSFASLEIRDGFNAIGSFFESGDLQRINANAFLGDLYLGTDQHIINADAVTALGGGDVTFNGAYVGDEDNQMYTVVTGDGDDTFKIRIDGDAVDAVTEGFSLDMGNGDNSALVSVTDNMPIGTQAGGVDNSNGFDDNGVSRETTNLLMNLDIVSGSGADYVEVQGMGTWNIDVNAGSDMVYINSGGAKGEGNLWNTTGPSAFAPMVVYKAQLAISVAGFESVVDINTGSNFILTEQKLNAAILAAIDANPEIARLVEAEVGTSNQDLIVRSLIDGDNEVGLQIRQPDLVATVGALTAGTSQVVLAEADVAGMTRDLVATGAAPNSTPVDTAAEIAALPQFSDNAVERFGNSADDYDGFITEFTANGNVPAGTTNMLIGTVRNDSVINMGTGDNDLVVLSANPGKAPLDGPAFSQNTLVFDDLNAGKVSIVNWFDLMETQDLISNGAGNGGANGNHLLDFTAFLTNRSTDTGSAESTVYEGIVVIAGNTMEANSMHFVDVDALEGIIGSNLNFATLNAAAVKAAIEFGAGGAGINYGAQAVTDGISTTGLALGTTARTSIIAVENVDTGASVAGELGGLESTNHGEYKFFQIIYGLTAEGDDSTVTVNEITVADFGDSIDTSAAGLEPNLVGSVTSGAADFV